MAVIKCKMCGGDLVLIEGQSVAECEYCGSRQTVPVADNEKKLIQFERAERLRKNCEFDKAAGLYEAIVSDFRQEAEAYWGLVLCKYGIEYVDDPATGKKIPTCHRSSFDSIMEDSDFEQALENADAVARRLYREEAKRIEEIRKGIIAVSANEQPYDIFICYKETDENGDRTLDSVLAQDIYDALRSKGYRTFFARISLEDKLGQEYEPYIFAALNSAKIMLAVGTDYEYYNAVWVKNEWSRYLKLMTKDKNKHLIPCYKGIDAYDMPREFAKLQAQDLGKIGAMQDLLWGVEKILPKQKSATVVQERVVIDGSGGSKVAPLLDRGYMALEDEQWSEANGFFDRVLDMDSKCGAAYFGLELAAKKLSTPERLGQSYPFYFHNTQDITESKNLQRARQFADAATAKKIAEFDAALKQKLHELEEEQRQLEEEQRKRQEVLTQQKINTAKKCMENGQYSRAVNLLKGAQDIEEGRILLAEATQKRGEEILTVLARARMGYKSFCINESGNMVIEGNTAGFSDNGLVLEGHIGNWGFINESGDRVIERIFHYASDFSKNGLACVERFDKYGYIDESGDMVIQRTFDAARIFSDNGLAPVKINGKWGYINETGKMVIQPTFDDARIFSDNGLARVKINGEWGYINETGKVVIQPIFNDAYDFSKNGLAPVKINGKWGYINETGKMVIQPTFHDAGRFSDNGLARVRINRKWGYVNEFGDMVIQPIFNDAYDFSKNGLAFVEINGKWGCINETGDMVIQPTFDDVNRDYRKYSFSDNGLACVRINRKWGYVNEFGDMVIQPTFDDAFDFHEIRKSAVQKREQRVTLAKEKRKLQENRRAQGLCQHCGGQLKGLFSKKCTNCGTPKDY